jgi:hypothetical protein
MDMSSIITDMIDCPQCGLPAQKDEFYIIGEERVNCNWCGYSHLKTIEGEESRKGYGSIHYAPKIEKENGSNQYKRIVKISTPCNIIRRHHIIMYMQKYCDTDNSSFYVWNEEEQRLECLIGNMPKTIDEEYQEQRDEADYYRSIEHSRALQSDEYTDF